MADTRSPDDMGKKVNWTRTVFEIDDKKSITETLNEQYVQSMLRKAAAAIEQKNYEAAEAYLQRGLARVPRHPECMAYMAICLAENKRRFVTAEKIAKEALRERPENARGHYALGRINLLGSRRRQAFQYFHRARSMATKDSQLEADLQKLEPRRLPVLSFLSRNHPLNIYLGKTRAFLLRRFSIVLVGIILLVTAIGLIAFVKN